MWRHERRGSFLVLTHTFFRASAPLTRQPYPSLWNLTYDHVGIPNRQIPFTKAYHSIRYIIHIIFIIYLSNTIHSLILSYIIFPFTIPAVLPLGIGYLRTEMDL